MTPIELERAAVQRIADALHAAGLEATPDVCCGLAQLAARMAVAMGLPRDAMLERVSAYYDEASSAASSGRAKQEGLAL